MGSIWGTNIKYSIFGESHGRAIGVVLDGLPSGIELDLHSVQGDLDRRRPGKDKLSTTRKEGDKFEIMSGFFNGRTTGTPLCAIIYNKNQRSRDYEKTKDIMRPGHADYTGFIRYSGFNDYRGGGHFSGRLTAPIVFAGAIAKEILGKKDIIIGSHIYQIGNIFDTRFNSININESFIEELQHKDLPVIDEDKGKRMKNLILEVKRDDDSIGGVVEGVILNLPPGIGNPLFNSVESVLSHILFSIPGVKGVEFGAGFDISKMKGSDANDEFFIEDDRVKTTTNNNGGILGGITNGMPVLFRVAFKPTPSIGKVQKTVNISKKQNQDIQVEGRHDPCIVQRALPVVEAVSAMAILDLIS